MVEALWREAIHLAEQEPALRCRSRSCRVDVIDHDQVAESASEEHSNGRRGAQDIDNDVAAGVDGERF